MAGLPEPEVGLVISYLVSTCAPFAEAKAASITDCYRVRGGMDTAPMTRVTGKFQIALSKLSLEERLRLFDEATQRAKKRAKGRRLPPAIDRGWSRDELYDRGSRVA